MSEKSASVTVAFDEGSGSGTTYSWETDSTKAEDPTEYSFGDTGVTAQAIKSVWLRLSPSIGAPIVKVTSGSIGFKTIGTDRKRVFLSFTGDESQPLGEELASAVVITRVGSAFNLAGVAEAISFTFDALTATVKASKPCYAVVEAVFTYSYRLYRYTFSGSCPYKEQVPVESSGLGSVSTTETEEPPFNTAVVWALDSATGRTGSMSLSGPSCSYQYPGSGGGANASGVEGNMPTVEFETIWSGLVSDGRNISAVTDFNVWPGEASVNVGSGFVHEGLSSSANLEESVNFNGLSSQLSRYPSGMATGSITWAEAAELSDGVYGPVPSGVACPGDRVVIGTWSSRNTYRVTGSKTVGPQEVVLTNGGGVTVPGKALATVSYSATYKKCRVYHELVTDQQDPNVITEAVEVVASATYMDGVGNTTFPPPPLTDLTKKRKAK